jgi:endogenous inhibitor of DNA gyrase (YacG/DUF329 family)
MTKILKPCPQCGKAPKKEFQPFCSKRCSDLDIGAWLSDGYRLPGSLRGRDSEVDELINELEKETNNQG